MPARPRGKISLIALFLVAFVCLPETARADVINWVLVRVTAGAGGLDSTGIKIGYRATSTREGPVVLGLGSSAPFIRPVIDLFDEGREGAVVSTTRSAGGRYVQMSLPGSKGTTCCSQFGFFGHIDPGQSYAALFFATNSDLRGVTTHVTLEGTGTTVVTKGGGATAVPIAGPANGGFGGNVGPLGLGRGFSYRTRTLSGLAGGVNWWECEVQCTGRWRSPDARTGNWSATDLHGELQIFGRASGAITYGGPAGEWSWTWNGAALATGVGSTVMGAWAPIGEAWTLFA